MECSHRSIRGDNYGRTCNDCGEVLAGYGEWGEGSLVCHHEFAPVNIDMEMCSFCGQERPINK